MKDPLDEITRLRAAARDRRANDSRAASRIDFLRTEEARPVNRPSHESWCSKRLLGLI